MVGKKKKTVELPTKQIIDPIINGHIYKNTFPKKIQKAKLYEIMFNCLIS